MARLDRHTLFPNLPLKLGCFHTHRALVVFTLGLILLVGLTTIVSDCRAKPADGPSPIPLLIELFTSEGCSSCPPADELLQKMDSLQPIPGAQLIVLSEHVDYWNHDGWTDPFSSADITDRQSAYARQLRLNSPFTPQFLVDGTGQFAPNDPQKILNALQQALAAPKIPLQVVSLSVEGERPTRVEGRVESGVNSQQHKADVFVAIALDHAESQVAKGENSGRHLTYVAVVAEIAKIGKLEPGRSFAQDFHLKLKLPVTQSKVIRLVVFAQEPGPGRVLGVVEKKVTID